jgi:hypothetical protein
MGVIRCYDIPVHACYHHVNQNIVYEWSQHAYVTQTPDFINQFLQVFDQCYISDGLGSKLSLAVAKELYTRKNIDLDGDLLGDYFDLTLKTSGIVECPVCMTEDDDTVKIICGHSFCRKCICDWCITGKPNCPLCRNKIYSTTIQT